MHSTMLYDQSYRLDIFQILTDQSAFISQNGNSLNILRFSKEHLCASRPSFHTLLSGHKMPTQICLQVSRSQCTTQPTQNNK